jgi:Domain of unknown function (DUF6460)
MPEPVPNISMMDDVQQQAEKHMFNQFIGGRPSAVIIRLVVVSILLGIMLSFFDIDPFNFWNSLRNLFLRIYDMGFGAFEWLVRYLALGAVIVVPLWIIGRWWKLYAK